MSLCRKVGGLRNFVFVVDGYSSGVIDGLPPFFSDLVTLIPNPQLSFFWMGLEVTLTPLHRSAGCPLDGEVTSKVVSNLGMVCFFFFFLVIVGSKWYLNWGHFFAGALY